VPEVITSAANPLVKRWRRLGERRERARAGEFTVEGGQPVWRAVDAGWTLRQLVVCRDLLTHPEAIAMVDDLEAAGVPVAHLSRELFTRISERDRPSGIGAIVAARSTPLGEFAVDADATLVALDQVGNPGNLGTIIRTADAAGAAAVVLIGHGADPFDPAAVKASMGSVFGLPVLRAADLGDFFGWAADLGITVAATTGAASTTIWEANYRRPLALLFGAEGPGLPDEAIERADLAVRIPMTGTAESLNLAVAVAVTLYDAQRGRLG